MGGRQGGILQSISGVSGASGGLKSQNFDFLTQKFKMSQNGSNSSQTQNGSNSSQKFKMAQNGSNSSQNGSNSSQTQNGSNSSQTHLKNSKWLKMAQTHLKMAQTHLKLKMAQTHLKLISKIQNGSKWLKLISKWLKLISNSKWLKLISNSSQKFKMAQNGSNSSQNGSNSKWLKLISNSSQKFKMAQTHLKSFNGRQGGILQSISVVSGASGGLKSQNFDFLTQKFKMAVFARFHFLKSKNPISGHN